MRGRSTRAAPGLLSQYSEASCFAVGGTSFYVAWAKTLKKGHDRPNENELEGLRERVLIEVRRQKLKIAKSMAREGRVQPGPSAAPLQLPGSMDSAMPDVGPLDDETGQAPIVPTPTKQPLKMGGVRLGGSEGARIKTSADLKPFDKVHKEFPLAFLAPGSTLDPDEDRRDIELDIWFG